MMDQPVVSDKYLMEAKKLLRDPWGSPVANDITFGVAKALARRDKEMDKLKHIIWLHHEVGYIQHMAKTIGGCDVCVEHFSEESNDHP